MNNIHGIIFSVSLVLASVVSGLGWLLIKPQISGAPPNGIALEEVPEIDPNDWRNGWVRPAGPARVGVQVGHWLNSQVPEELENLRGNTGASGDGKSEWEVNMAIAELIQDKLEASGVEVDLLPATVPPRYWADVFISIHADGSLDTQVSGYKFAAPWRDLTGRAEELVEILNSNYGQATGLVYDPNITRNMRGYYAFAWWRYEHAIHPMTTAVIAETGFLTNANDRRLIVDQPEISADAIADSLIEFLESEGLI